MHRQREVRVALVIDDEDLIRKMLALFLGERGLTVLQAATGEAGIQMLQEHPEIEVVVCDFHMPGMNGHEVFLQIREFLHAHCIDFVATSGGAYGAKDALAALCAEPGVRFLPKPCTFDQMCALVLGEGVGQLMA